MIPSGGKFRWLDFDIENRPSTYWYDGQTTAEITAIAACFIGQPKSMRVWLLGRDDPVDMLLGFKEMYDAADGVVGHYIRMHDLPILQAHYILYDLPTLGPKLTCDTKLDLIGFKDIPKTQENLCEIFGVKLPKVHMTQAKWREANQLTPEGLYFAEKRAVGDVRQNIALRKEELQRDLLGPPKVWRP